MSVDLCRLLEGTFNSVFINMFLHDLKKHSNMFRHCPIKPVSFDIYIILISFCLFFVCNWKIPNSWIWSILFSRKILLANIFHPKFMASMCRIEKIRMCVLFGFIRCSVNNNLYIGTMHFCSKRFANENLRPTNFLSDSGALWKYDTIQNYFELCKIIIFRVRSIWGTAP